MTEDILFLIKNTSTEDLKQWIKRLESEIETRNENRKKELWGNVIAALSKYEEETGRLVVFSPKKAQRGPDFCEWSSTCPGIINIE